MTPVIRIPDDVFRRLQRVATPLVDSPADVVERLISFYETQQQLAPLRETAEAPVGVSAGEYETYENHANPHVTIHKKGCSQLRKRGGIHRHGQGSYKGHATLAEARQYAESTGLPVRLCRFCNPS